MSLINQMLKDLEQQQGRQPESETPVLQGLNARPAQPSGKASWRKKALMLGLGLLTCIAGVIAYQKSMQQSNRQSIQLAMAKVHDQNTIEHGETLATQAELTPLQSQQDGQKSEPQATATPVEPMAEVPSAAPVAPEAPQAAAPVILATTTGIPKSSAPVPNRTSAESSLRTATKPTAQRSSAPTPDPNMAQRLPPAMVKTNRPLQPAQQSRHYYIQGQRHLQQGALTLADEALRKSLRLDPNNRQARLLLAKLYVQQGRLSNAEQLLHLGVTLHPNDTQITKLAARIAIERGNLQQGIAYLTQALPAIEQDPEHHAMLAASYQRNGAHTAAAKVYQTLLAAFPQKGIWWMGLGISQAQIGEWQDAHQAFVRAQQIGGLNSASATYVDTQISQLTKKLQ